MKCWHCQGQMMRDAEDGYACLQCGARPQLTMHDAIRLMLARSEEAERKTARGWAS